MKCEWCGKEVKNRHTAYKMGNEYNVCAECFENQNDICDICHKRFGINDLNVILSKSGSELHLCDNCLEDYNNNTVCDWCGDVDKVHGKYKVRYNDDDYYICDKCNAHYLKNTCRQCGEQMSRGQSIMGLCLNCFQVREDNIYKEQIKSGLDLTKLQNYLEETHMTYDAFIEWITGSWISPITGKPYNDRFGPQSSDTDTGRSDSRTSVRNRLIRDLLKSEYGWTEELIKSNMDDILVYFCKYLDRLISGTYIMIIPSVARKYLKWTKTVDPGNLNVSILEQYKIR